MQFQNVAEIGPISNQNSSVNTEQDSYPVAAAIQES